MGVEIERKFLLKKAEWDMLIKPKGDFYRQGYILATTSKTIRVRITNETAFITIKGNSTGLARLEYEYEIPQIDAKELLNNFAETELEKVRFKIKIGNHIWEIDHFYGENEGLLLAEIELESEEETFEKPNWIGQEVTSDAKYYNSNLTKHPFKKW